MTGVLLAICIVSQFFKNLSIFITGPVVNTCIILAVLMINLACGIILSIITPVTYSAAALDEPCAKTNMQYYYYEESDEDVFILPNKETGIAFNTEA